jgi:hypothetical protein
MTAEEVYRQLREADPGPRGGWPGWSSGRPRRRRPSRSSPSRGPTALSRPPQPLGEADQHHADPARRQLPVLVGGGEDLRRARPLRDRPEPRAARPRRRQPRRRTLRRDGRQRLALEDRGERRRRRPHPARRAPGRGAHRPHPALPHRPLRRAAGGDAGRDRDRRGGRAGRLPRPARSLPRLHA